MSESKLVIACIEWLETHKCYVWRNNTGALKNYNGRFIRFGLLGSADILGMNPNGRFIAVECKYGNNTLSDPQKKFGKRVSLSNGVYVVAYSIDDLEAAKDELLS